MNKRNFVLIGVVVVAILLLAAAGRYYRNSRIDNHDAVSNYLDLEESMPLSERVQLFEAARSYASTHAVPNMQFDLVIYKHEGDWIRFKLLPENVETDIADLYMEKVDGNWVGRSLGTGDPGLTDAPSDLFQ